MVSSEKDHRENHHPGTLKFFCLLRESSDPQMQKKGLDRQRRQVCRFAETWDGGSHEIAYSVQISESASKGNRYDWQEAVEQGIQYYQQGRIDAILFPEVDRESRNPLISVPILNLALSAGVPVFFAEEELRLDPNDADVIERYTSEMAKSCAYLATMRRKTKGGRFDRAALDHKLPSNTKMTGFDIVDGKRVPNQAEAEALREAAQISLKNKRLAPAADWLNEKGFRTTVGKPFSTVTLHGLFSNDALIGETTINFKEKTVVLHHEPILDATVYEALQVMFKENRLRAARSRTTYYALSGLTICGCGEKFEPTKTGANRYYYRCSKHCGEKAWIKDVLEWEIYDGFSHYLEHRESQQKYLELAQKSQAKLENDLAQVKSDLSGNDREWRTLLNKELADYPDIIIAEKKRRLTAERQTLESAKARLEAELIAVPQIEPAEVELALSELSKPFRMANSGGYGVPNPMSWERASVVSGKWRPDMPRKLTEEQAHLLRSTLLKLNCHIILKNRTVFISGKLALTSVRVKQATTSSTFVSPTYFPIEIEVFARAP